MPTCLTKVIALTILLLVLVLLAFGGALSREQATMTPDMHDYRYAEPFRGSEGGKTLARACGKLSLKSDGHVVPISWWIERHVREGRQELNFTEWPMYSVRRRRDELESICGLVSNGRMPPVSYRVLHPESRLKTQDKKVICAWAANESEQER